MPGGPPIIPMRLQPLPEFKPFEQPVIAHDKVRYVGEPIAVVLARQRRDRRGRAGSDRRRDRGAAGGGGLARPRRSDQSLLFESRRHQPLADVPARARATPTRPSRDAPYVRRERLRTGRHYGLTMEPRGVMAQWDAAKGRLTVSGAAKVPFFNRRILAKQIGLPEDAIEMIENDVGGGFGARGEFYPEDFLIPFAARHVNRPVKWIEDRRENLMAMNHAREAEADLEIACARDGTILALRGEVHTDMGAYMRTNGAVGARNVAQFMAGPYRVPHVKIDSLAVDDQQDAGRHLSRAGPLRGQLLPRADARHGGGRSRHRPRRVPPPQSDHQRRAALSDRARPADRRQGRIRQRRLPRDARPLPEGDRLGREGRSSRAS